MEDPGSLTCYRSWRAACRPRSDCVHPSVPSDPRMSPDSDRRANSGKGALGKGRGCLSPTFKESAERSQIGDDFQVEAVKTNRAAVSGRKNKTSCQKGETVPLHAKRCNFPGDEAPISLGAVVTLNARPPSQLPVFHSMLCGKCSSRTLSAYSGVINIQFSWDM